jgi:hypothetical protein
VSTQESGTADSAAGQPSEEELRAAYEAELSRISSADMVLQATVSLLNIGARRLGLVGGSDPAAPQQASPERDLEQVRDAIDAVRGLMPVIERRAPQEARPLRDALSQLQMAYARESQAAAAAQGQAGEQEQPAATPQGGPPATEPAPAPGAPQAPQNQPTGPGPGGKPAPGPAESSGRLWVPGR